MFFQQNLPRWERNTRLGAGVLMVACGLLGLGLTPAGYGLAAIGLFTGLTGLVGFCPACAMAGRKLDRHLGGQ